MRPIFTALLLLPLALVLPAHAGNDDRILDKLLGEKGSTQIYLAALAQAKGHIKGSFETMVLLDLLEEQRARLRREEDKVDRELSVELLTNSVGGSKSALSVIEGFAFRYAHFEDDLVDCSVKGFKVKARGLNLSSTMKKSGHLYGAVEYDWDSPFGRARLVAKAPPNCEKSRPNTVEVRIVEPADQIERVAGGFDVQRTSTGMRITHIVPDSAAEKAGLKIGDVIAKIGYRESHEFTDHGFEFRTRGKPGSSFKITLSNGTEHTLSRQPVGQTSLSKPDEASDLYEMCMNAYMGHNLFVLGCDNWYQINREFLSKTPESPIRTAFIKRLVDKYSFAMKEGETPQFEGYVNTTVDAGTLPSADNLVESMRAVREASKHSLEKFLQMEPAARQGMLYVNASQGECVKGDCQLGQGELRINEKLSYEGPFLFGNASFDGEIRQDGKPPLRSYFRNGLLEKVRYPAPGSLEWIARRYPYERNWHWFMEEGPFLKGVSASWTQAPEVMEYDRERGDKPLGSLQGDYRILLNDYGLTLNKKNEAVIKTLNLQHARLFRQGDQLFAECAVENCFLTVTPNGVAVLNSQVLLGKAKPETIDELIAGLAPFVNQQEATASPQSYVDTLVNGPAKPSATAKYDDLAIANALTELGQVKARIADKFGEVLSQLIALKTMTIWKNENRRTHQIALATEGLQIMTMQQALLTWMQVNKVWPPRNAEITETLGVVRQAIEQTRNEIAQLNERSPTRFFPGSVFLTEEHLAQAKIVAESQPYVSSIAPPNPGARTSFSSRFMTDSQRKAAIMNRENGGKATVTWDQIYEKFCNAGEYHLQCETRLKREGVLK